MLLDLLPLLDDDVASAQETPVWQQFPLQVIEKRGRTRLRITTRSSWRLKASGRSRFTPEVFVLTKSHRGGRSSLPLNVHARVILRVRRGTHRTVRVQTRHGQISELWLLTDFDEF